MALRRLQDCRDDSFVLGGRHGERRSPAQTDKCNYEKYFFYMHIFALAALREMPTV